MTTTSTHLGEHLRTAPTGTRSIDQNAALAVAVAAISATIRREHLPAPIDIAPTQDGGLVVTLHGGAAALLDWRDALRLDGDIAVQLSPGRVLTGAAVDGVFEQVHVGLRAAVTR